MAIKNVEASEYASKITLYKALAEDVMLDHRHVDVIVSEWMGYMLLCENVLPSVIKFRSKYLAPGGRMVPSAGSIDVAGFAAR